MNTRVLNLRVAGALAGCAGHGRSDAKATPRAPQPLVFVGDHGWDSATVRYSGVAYVRSNEIDVVLREGRMPRTGPFSGTLLGFSMALASGDPGWNLRVKAESDQVDVKKVHAAGEMLADSVVFRIRHVEPDSLAGMWFVVHEWRLWHRDGLPEIAPVAAARSTDVFRPGGTVAPAPVPPNGP